jgi:hypothetical protein
MQMLAPFSGGSNPYWISSLTLLASTYGKRTWNKVLFPYSNPKRWTQAFSAMVALGALVIRAPGSTLASSALTEINIAAEVGLQIYTYRHTSLNLENRVSAELQMVSAPRGYS